MNILEHYIIEILNEEVTDKFVRVRLISNCYGSTDEYTKLFLKDEWEEAKKKGYYLE